MNNKIWEKAIMAFAVVVLSALSFMLGWYVRPNNNEIVATAIIKWEENERAKYSEMLQKLTAEQISAFVDKNGGVIISKQALEEAKANAQAQSNTQNQNQATTTVK